MTSEDFIEDLRRNGVKLIKNDGSLVEIPFEFATEACIYENDGWWDFDELLESFMELLWA